MNPTDQILKRTYRYWYEDGLAELAGASIFALMGLLFYIQALAPHGPVTALSALILPVIVIAGMLSAKRIVRTVKERVTYPRTGFVSYRSASRARRWWTAVPAMVLASLTAAWVLRGGLPFNTLLLLQGWIIAVGFALPGWRYGLRRFFWLAVLSGLAGTFVSRSGWGIDLSDAAFFGALALGLALSGGLTLCSYLRHTQPPAEA
jgi:hypothetical protein